MNLLIRASQFLISPLPVPAGWYAIPLRLVVGFGFMQHGYAKLARGPEDFINILHAIAVPAPYLLGWATIIVEIVGGLLIVGGAFVPVARYQWSSSCSLRSSRCIFRMASARSISSPSTLPALISDSRVTRRTFSISRRSSLCVLAVLARSQSMGS
jgi:hypothetical protein